MNKSLKLILTMTVTSLLLACQSQPTKTTTSKATQQHNAQGSSSTSIQVTTREVPVIRSKDGVQDIRWIISQIKNKKALFFNQMPYLVLSSAQQRVQAHTGCNAIYGTYNIHVPQKTLNFEVKAGHMSCDNALSQEADLIDALASAEIFQINGRSIQLMDKNRQILLIAQQP